METDIEPDIVKGAETGVETGVEIDHIFILAKPDDACVIDIRRLGLAEQYRRKHPGQGTENVCYAFDNLYVECLWVNDDIEIQSAAIKRTGLYQRSQWRDNSGCPFGLAWRNSNGSSITAECWDYCPPYLPAGAAIRVAVDSDDCSQPFMFESIGNTSPLNWPPERRGELQSAAGLSTVQSISLELPSRVAFSTALLDLSAHSGLQLGHSQDDRYRIKLMIRQTSSKALVPLCLG